ncbi:hypothetical protein ElyMa_003299400 [Elysia marginata]|uniref:Uncharacterized protein n=1 Tax=Elysia marginata TaxID=1093978 RepID=A0AAV4JAJ9_9GAST|nr:hypothetical protein ElyMa_003299400 [Elysia marginata]
MDDDACIYSTNNRKSNNDDNNSNSHNNNNKGTRNIDRLYAELGETVNSDCYIDTLKRLRARILRVRPDMDIGNVFLLHDNA